MNTAEIQKRLNLDHQATTVSITRNRILSGLRQALALMALGTALANAPFGLANDEPAPGARRQAIEAKLERITFDLVQFVHLPLKDVLIYLDVQTRQRDPGQPHINFLISYTQPSGLRESRFEPPGRASAEAVTMLQRALAEQDKKVATAQAKVAALREDPEKSGLIGIQEMPMDSESLRRVEKGRQEALNSSTNLSALLEDLKKLDRPKLRELLPSRVPDSNLSEMLTRFAKAQQELAALRKELGDQHPNVERTKNFVAVLDRQIDTKEDAILDGLQQQIDSLNETVAVSTSLLEKAKKQDAGKLYGEYYEAKRDLDFARQIRQTLALKLADPQAEARRTNRSQAEKAPAGAPLRPDPATATDLEAVRVHFTLPLRDVRLKDVLDAIAEVAERPLTYSVTDYGVIFFSRD
jgi:hypothetical protein